VENLASSSVCTSTNIHNTESWCCQKFSPPQQQLFLLLRLLPLWWLDLKCDHFLFAGSPKRLIDCSFFLSGENPLRPLDDYQVHAEAGEWHE
jgi:hypothetical protein